MKHLFKFIYGNIIHQTVEFIYFQPLFMQMWRTMYLWQRICFQMFPLMSIWTLHNCGVVIRHLVGYFFRFDFHKIPFKRILEPRRDNRQLCGSRKCDETSLNWRKYLWFFQTYRFSISSRSCCQTRDEEKMRWTHFDLFKHHSNRNWPEEKFTLRKWSEIREGKMEPN